MKRDMGARMLSEGLVRDYSRLLDVEQTKLNDQIGRSIGTAVNQLAGRGILHSSAGMKLVIEAASPAIPIFAQAALNLLLRSSGAHGIPLNRGNLAEFEEELSNQVRRETELLKQETRSTPPFKMRGMEGAADNFLQELDRAASLEITRIGSELSLIAATNELPKTDAGTGSPNFVINAPVGVLQTGPGSFGVASFTIDTAACEALGAAFDKILAQVSSLQDADVTFDRQEIVELATEAKTETSKTKPNSAKLKSFVTGLGSAISFAPKLKDAYDTLKWAGTMAGLTLP